MKSIWKSKTFWVNLIVMLIGLSKLLEPTLPLPAAKDVIVVVGGLNIVLRFLTTMPVGMFGDVQALQAAQAAKGDANASTPSDLSTLGRKQLD